MEHRTGIVAGLVVLITLHATVAGAQSLDDAQRDQVAANFRAADADGDGALTSSEFVKLIDLNAKHDIGRAKVVARLKRYPMAFRRADANADGRVTTNELAGLRERR